MNVNTDRLHSLDHFLERIKKINLEELMDSIKAGLTINDSTKRKVTMSIDSWIISHNGSLEGFQYKVELLDDFTIKVIPMNLFTLLWFKGHEVDSSLIGDKTEWEVNEGIYKCENGVSSFKGFETMDNISLTFDKI